MPVCFSWLGDTREGGFRTTVGAAGLGLNLSIYHVKGFVSWQAEHMDFDSFPKRE